MSKCARAFLDFAVGCLFLAVVIALMWGIAVLAMDLARWSESLVARTMGVAWNWRKILSVVIGVPVMAYLIHGLFGGLREIGKSLVDATVEAISIFTGKK